MWLLQERFMLRDELLFTPETNRRFSLNYTAISSKAANLDLIVSQVLA
jgi:siderophore synthetase component